MFRSLMSSIRIAASAGLTWTVKAFVKLSNRFVPWHRLPTPLALLNLSVLRDELRLHNLHDTANIPDAAKQPPEWKPEYRYARCCDGSYNDLHEPTMGAAGTRFGRNFPLDKVWPDKGKDLLAPNPMKVADTVLARSQFLPAESLNILAAAWIQFQNHEWFNHKRFDHYKDPDKIIEIEVPDGSTWHESTMRIERTLKDYSRDSRTTDLPPTYLSEETHWWDGSQIYGSSLTLEKTVRSFNGGKMKLEQHGSDWRLPHDPNSPGVDLTGFSQNYWVGVALLHTLFAQEHNAICDALAQRYPRWNDQRLFVTAKLINSALMAKIHTVEWTPGILAHPALQIGMDANWWGLVGERLTNLIGRLSKSEAISGIPGSPVDHHTAPYYLTEEFVAVYRLHPLIPDDYEFMNLQNKSKGSLSFTEIQGGNTREVMNRIGMANLFYSLGRAHPGAITLRNYPNALRSFERPDGFKLDLAVVDIMRDRERGVPRYNAFRELLRMPRIPSFDRLTQDPTLAKELKELYEGDIDRVDLMVGLYAEQPPKGFGFSDTAFRIFILMASRRLKSDRFFTTDFTEEVYTKVGMDWIKTSGFASVLRRHFPELAPALQNLANPFEPWYDMQAREARDSREH